MRQNSHEWFNYPNLIVDFNTLLVIFMYLVRNLFLSLSFLELSRDAVPSSQRFTLLQGFISRRFCGRLRELYLFCPTFLFYWYIIICLALDVLEAMSRVEVFKFSLFCRHEWRQKPNQRTGLKNNEQNIVNTHDQNR